MIETKHKCTSCGARLEIDKESGIGLCEHCGTEYVDKLLAEEATKRAAIKAIAEIKQTEAAAEAAAVVAIAKAQTKVRTKNRNKQLLTKIISLVLVLAVLGGGAFAMWHFDPFNWFDGGGYTNGGDPPAVFTPVDGVNFKPVGETYQFLLHGEFSYTTVVIPAVHNQKAVTAIAENAFKGFDNITQIVIPASITTIGSDAFSGATALNMLFVPQSVLNLNENAFRGADNLTIYTDFPQGISVGGWHANFNPDGLTINWGASRSFVQTIDPSLQFTVTFNLNGATGFAPLLQTVSATQQLQVPDAPTRSGFVFSGWYTNAQGTGQPFNFSAPVGANTTLYAGWLATNDEVTVLQGSTHNIGILGRSDNWFTFYATTTGEMTIWVTGFGRITGPGWARNTVYRPAIVTMANGFVPTQERNAQLTNAHAAWARVPEANIVAQQNVDVYGNGNFGFAFEVVAGQTYYLFLRGHEETNGMNATANGTVRFFFPNEYEGGFANLITGTHEVIRHNDVTKDFIIPPATQANHVFNGWFSEQNGGGDRITDEKGARVLNPATAVPAEIFAYFTQ
jgi:uncharacterized repeat protein (TIGR02543 family)